LRYREDSAGGELPIPPAFSGGDPSEDGGYHLIVVLEGGVVVFRWSVLLVLIIVAVILLLVLEFLGEAVAVLHLVLGIFVERTGSIQDLLVLLVVAPLGVGFTDRGDVVVWSASTKLGRFGPLSSIARSVKAAISIMWAVVVGATVEAAVVWVLVCSRGRGGCRAPVSSW
jgi:hypothetical protein